MKNEKLNPVVEPVKNGMDRLEQLAGDHAAVTQEVNAKAVTKRHRRTKEELEAARRASGQVVPTKQILSPAILGPVLRLPYLAAATMSKSEAWLLTPDEEQVLSESGCAVLDAWYPEIDPKFASVIAFSTALIVITGQKMLIRLEERKAQKKAAEEKEQNKLAA